MDIRVARSLACIALAASLFGCGKPEPVVTPGEYSQLSAGMTLEQAEKVIGAPATAEGSTTRSDGKLEQRFSWANPDGSFVQIVTLNGKLTEKGSSGLK